MRSSGASYVIPTQSTRDQHKRGSSQKAPSMSQSLNFTQAGYKLDQSGYSSASQQ